MNIAIIILAAGEAKRMGHPDRHKLMALWDNEPLVRRVAQQALASTASSVTVVTGYRSQAVEDSLTGLTLSIVHNHDYAEGMGRSLATGLHAAGIDHTDGVLVMLADMPSVTSYHLDRVMAAFRACAGRSVIRASSAGIPGHPVVLPRSLYGALRELQGDVGARDVVASSMLPVVFVEVGSAALHDIDTLDDLLMAGGRLPLDRGE